MEGSAYTGMSVCCILPRAGGQTWGFGGLLLAKFAGVHLCVVGALGSRMWTSDDQF